MIERNKEYAKIGRRLIRSLPEFEDIRNAGVRIAFLSSDEEKTKDRKLVLGDCRKVNKQYEWCCKYDFMITIYEPNILELDDQQKEILLIHELHHVGVDQEGNEPSFYIVPHDIEEFWSIINRFGIGWQEGEAKKCQEEIIQTAEKT